MIGADAQDAFLQSLVYWEVAYPCCHNTCTRPSNTGLCAGNISVGQLLLTRVTTHRPGGIQLRYGVRHGQQWQHVVTLSQQISKVVAVEQTHRIHIRASNNRQCQHKCSSMDLYRCFCAGLLECWLCVLWYRACRATLLTSLRFQNHIAVSHSAVIPTEGDFSPIERCSASSIFSASLTIYPTSGNTV